MTTYLKSLALCLALVPALSVRTCFGQAGLVRVSDTAGLVSELARLTERRAGGDDSPVTIEIDVPVLRLDRTLELDERTIGRGLTIQPVPELAEACFTGAVELVHSGGDDRVWRYKLPSHRNAAVVPRQLLVNSRLSSPARHPNIGTLRIDQANADRRSGFTVPADCFPSGFANDASTADLVFLHDWSSSRLPIQSFDEATRQLVTVGPIGCEAKHYAIDHFEPHPRFWVEGAESLADAPGEWWIDRSAGEVVMLKIADSDPPRVELPQQETLLQVKSFSGSAVSGLKLEGICFQGSRFPMPPGGLAGAQATMHEPRDATGARQTGNRPMLSAAVQLEQVTGATLTRCRFVSLCNTGLWLGSRCKDCVVTGCEFSELGGNAINIGEDGSRKVNNQTWYQAEPSQVPSNHRVVECTIREIGRVLPGSVGIWAAINRSLSLENNTITDVPYTGISLGWVWNDSETPAGENRIRGNRIQHAMQLLSDGGGIYTLGRQPGTVIEQNDISGVPHAAGRAESNGMFLDEGTTGLTIRDNVIRFVAQSPLRFHRAGKNQVTHNRWELATTSTAEIRFNNTPQANITSTDNEVIKRPERVFLIGNSLTWDTLPASLDGEVHWHIDCGKNLPYIRQHPESPCVASSTLWPRGLRLGPYDYVVFQPHYGSTVEQDAETIQAWLIDQPDATLVIHTGWARQSTVREELTAGIETTRHNDAYFEALRQRLLSDRPSLRIRTTNAFRLLADIDRDIQAGSAPIAQLADLYRDDIHMSNELGRPMMHSLMRITLGQTMNFQPQASVEKTVVDYVRHKLDEAQTRLLPPDNQDN